MVDVLENGDFEHRLQLLIGSRLSGELAVQFKYFDMVAVGFDGTSVEVVEPAQFD